MFRRVVLAFAVVCAGACSSTVEVRPGARELAPSVTTVVALPTSLDWGQPADQRRLQRRTGDLLLELTGGRAVITDELTGDDDASVQETLRALGEEPAGAISFRVRLSVGKRLVNNANPISSFTAGRRLVIDYTADVEVRRVGSNDPIGNVQSIASGPANEPEVGPKGEHRGPLEALDDALAEAVRTFAPRLASARGTAYVVEVPRAAASNVVKRLTVLAELYPELPLEELQRLGSTGERFLVVSPGALSRFGVEPGDLLGVPGGETAASRAALLRAVAKGQRPLLAIDRKGQHFILAGAP